MLYLIIKILFISSLKVLMLFGYWLYECTSINCVKCAFGCCIFSKMPTICCCFLLFFCLFVVYVENGYNMFLVSVCMNVQI